jgi:hypothetical protein
MIKTWQQRCEEHPDHEGIVSEQMIRDRMQEEIDELRQALSEPEQEPVAWGVFEGNLHDMFFTEAEAVEMAQLKGTHAEAKPLYTAPQRTWVGLTHEEVEEVWEQVEASDFLDCVHPLARAIEAKLRERNT